MKSNRTEDVWWVPSTGAANTQGCRVLVHLNEMVASLNTLDVGVALATGTDTGLVLVQSELYPPLPSFSRSEGISDASKTHLEVVVDLLRADYDGPLSAVVRADYSLGRLLGSAADDFDVDFVVIDGDETAVPKVVNAVDHDVVAAHNETEMDRVQSILVPVAGGPDSNLAVRVAGAVARHSGGWVELLHVIGPNATAEERENANRLLADLSTVPTIDNVDTRLITDQHVVDAIVEQSAYYDCTVVGAPTKSRLARFASGSTTDTVQTEVEGLVLAVWDQSR